MNLSNHEIWRECERCNEVWDARSHGLECPKCKKESSNQKIQKHVKTKISR